MCVCVCVLGILSRAPLPRRSIYGGVAPPRSPGTTPLPKTQTECIAWKEKGSRRIREVAYYVVL